MKGEENGNYREILKELEKAAGGCEYRPESLGTGKFCYKISVPARRKIARGWVKTNDISPDEFINLLNLLYHGRSHEEISFAGLLLEGMPALRKTVPPEKLEEWLGHTEGWAEVDSLCQSNFSAVEVLGKWSKWKKLIEKLSQNSNPHKIRASMVLLVKPSRESSDPRISDLALAMIERHKEKTSILITKAISWLLRSLITNHRSEVEGYLSKNRLTLPKIAVRETERKLLTGKK
ncbi:MAG: DNA alkylation repair protein [bacterium]|nr:DNA alkylation repair protein [bacterium]